MVGGRGHGEEGMSRLGPIKLPSTVYPHVYAAKTQWPGGFKVQCRTVSCDHTWSGPHKELNIRV